MESASAQDPLLAGLAAGIARAANGGLREPSGEVVEDALEQVRVAVQELDEEVHPRFIAFCSETVVVAAAAREHYEDPALTDQDVSRFLRVFGELLNSFRHA